ncbi:hypothetical protein P692DRAFT_201156560 [Suillus brevipes Sb2]|nr:hypothetical protein P692DRAFT_201156560 [Suillus brevipes Sb2]
MGADTYNDDIKRVTFFLVLWAVFLPTSRSTVRLASASGRKLVKVNPPLGMRRRCMSLPKEAPSCTT